MTLWLMVGIPGSGKSYFAKNKLINGLGWRYISRDEVRYSIIKDEDEYFSHENEVFEKFVDNINASFLADSVNNIIADATHLNEKSRMKLLKALKLKNIDVIPVVMETDLETSIKQNNNRKGRSNVPLSAIKRMYASMTDPVNDNFNYTAIMYVNKNKKVDYVEKPRFMYHKDNIRIKEIPIKNIIKKEE